MYAKDKLPQVGLPNQGTHICNFDRDCPPPGLYQLALPSEHLETTSVSHCPREGFKQKVLGACFPEDKTVLI